MQDWKRGCGMEISFVRVLRSLARKGPERRYNCRMKSGLKAGLSFSKTILVDEARCIGFMGKEGMVYATPKMVSDVEYTCRDFLLGHLDAGEDSVGAQVLIDHLAATPLGLGSP